MSDSDDDINKDVEELVSRVHAQYASCGFRPSNEYQFTVLAAFVLSLNIAPAPSASDGSVSTKPEVDAGRWKVVSFATGSKCLPTSKYPHNGDALHDSHAEVLARRGFVRWIYEEILRTAHTSSSSEWIEHLVSGMWTLKRNVKVHMYISTVPCGDASMRFLASTQDPSMAALKDSVPPVPPPAGGASRGRDNYSLFGVLRTKPGRADSPRTICMSCSDRIAAWNVLGLQGALLAELIHPVYIDQIVIGDVEDALQAVVLDDCKRALYGRLGNIIENHLPSFFRVSKPAVIFSPIQFIHSRTAISLKNPGRAITQSSNESLCWFADSPNNQEVLVNGVRRGVGAKLRKLELYRPRLCKISLFRLYNDVMRLSRNASYDTETCTYHQSKSRSEQYRLARETLRGDEGPFHGWIVSGKQWESFDTGGSIISTEYADEEARASSIS